MTFSPFITLILLPFIYAAALDKTQLDRPRGVPLSKRPLYDPSKDFQCLDASKSIPYEHVNNDYCDCPDGSDEPGTSACSNGRFYCVNIGHRPLYQPSSRVNDGICDCCDGSDEYSGLVQCDNICEELGREARQEAERKLAIVKEGFNMRKNLAIEGKKLVDENTKKLEELRKQRDELEPKKKSLEEAKIEAEKLETEARDAFNKKHEEERNAKRRVAATEVFERLDVDKDQKLSLEELKQLKEFDRDADGQVSDDEAKRALAYVEESDLEHFVEKVWPEFRLHYIPPDEGETTQEEAPSEEARTQEEEEEEDIGDEDNDRISDYETERWRREDERRRKYEDEEKAPPYDEATQALITAADEARNALRNVEDEIRKIDSDISDAEKYTGSTYGVDHAWAPLKEQCFEYSDMQYVYKLCLFGRATQKPKNGGGETSLGNWGEWKEKDGDEYAMQMYKNGQGCWNGPDRSTKVVMSCGTETKLIAASEPARCEYEFTLETPAACSDPATLSIAFTHEEL